MNKNSSLLLNNKAIIELLISGESRKGMSLLFDTYFNLLVGTGFLYLNDLHAAEDIVQELFITFWKDKKYTIVEPEKLAAYFQVSVRNKCFNRIEKKDILRHVYTLDQIDFAVEEYNENHDVIFSKISKEIDLLPPRTKGIMNDVFIGQLKYNEVADKHGITPSTVRSLLSNALKKIREKLDTESFNCLLFYFLHARSNIN